VLQMLNQFSGIIALVAVLVAAAALALVKALQPRVKAVTPDTRALIRGLKGKDASEALQETFAHIQAMSQRLTLMDGRVLTLEDQLGRSVQKVGLTRFNSDDSIRGDMSFALALLDSTDDGVIISSLYSLDACRVFIRTVEGGKTRHNLMPEEAKALAEALATGAKPGGQSAIGATL